MYSFNSIHHYHSHDKTADDYGYWRVFTEDDKFGKCNKQLGIHVGELHKLAFILFEFATHTLDFESLVNVEHSNEHNEDYVGYKHKKAVVYTDAVDNVQNAVKNNEHVKLMVNNKQDFSLCRVKIELSCQSDE